MGKTKQEEIIKIFFDFCKLPKEKQMYVSGVIAGLSIPKESQRREKNI
ncbi:MULTISPECIES: hypothetical protein [Clostridium]|nr:MULTISPECIES: hypothetical protein [Clostridium]MCD3217452.1 hypothetical protein [Clostridium botulinum C]